MYFYTVITYQQRKWNFFCERTSFTVMYLSQSDTFIKQSGSFVTVPHQCLSEALLTTVGNIILVTSAIKNIGSTLDSFLFQATPRF
jgi:hypothetical protein